MRIKTEEEIRWRRSTLKLIRDDSLADNRMKYRTDIAIKELNWVLGEKNEV